MLEQPPRVSAKALSGGVVILVLQAVGDGPPVPVRMRRLLKAALRGYGLRCLQCDLPRDDGGGAAEGRAA